MWGSFGIYIDLPKLEDSEVTMKARLTKDPEMEVRKKLIGYIGQALLSWHVGIIWDAY